MGVPRQHVNKEFTLITAAEQSMQVGAGLLQACVQGCMYTPDDGQQVRHEHQFHTLPGDGAQTLLDLRQVAMSAGGISGKGFPGLTELCPHGGAPPRTADAGFGIRDEAVRFHQVMLQQRQKAQLYHGRIAARVGNQARACDIGPVGFGQTVHGLA